MAATPGDARFCFVVEWYDPHSGMNRRFNLMLWEKDLTVEVYDVKARRTFLKRCEPPEPVALADYYIGGVVTVYSRRFTILEFADELTKRRFQVARSTTLGIIKPDAYPHLGKIIDIVYKNNLDIGRMKMVKLSPAQAGELAARRPASERGSLAAHLSRDAVVAMEIVGHDAVSAWHAVMGPVDPEDAKLAAPRSIRAQFGTDAVFNAVYGSATADDAAREIAMLFDSATPSTAVYDNCALVLVKPHVVTKKLAGQVLDDLMSATGLEVSALQTMALDPTDAEDYLEVYKGVVAEYARWIVELSSGPCVAVQVRGEDAVRRVREWAGPFDPEIARHLRPDTIRARLGTDSVRNAVHVTDLPRDGPLECKFMFHVV